MSRVKLRNKPYDMSQHILRVMFVEFEYEFLRGGGEHYFSHFNPV